MATETIATGMYQAQNQGRAASERDSAGRGNYDAQRQLDHRSPAATDAQATMPSRRDSSGALVSARR
jgi:hypothetical protein